MFIYGTGGQLESHGGSNWGADGSLGVHWEPIKVNSCLLGVTWESKRGQCEINLDVTQTILCGLRGGEYPGMGGRSFPGRAGKARGRPQRGPAKLNKLVYGQTSVPKNVVGVAHLTTRAPKVS